MKENICEIGKVNGRACLNCFNDFDGQDEYIFAGDFVWCLHCARVFKWDGLHDVCPYEGCYGNPIDFHKWIKSEWPRVSHSEYPEVPILGVVYSL